MVAQHTEGVRLFVYALCEPDGRTIRYIGVTANLWKRLHNHYHHATMPKVREWVFSLRKQGMFPAMIVLEQAEGLEAGLAAEREQIERHRALLGDQLLNERHAEGASVPRAHGKKFVFNGRSQTKAQWAKELGITRQALDLRLQSHPPDVALSRGKDSAYPLTDKRLAPKHPHSNGVLSIDVPGCLQTRLSQAERRERRKKMSAAFASGLSREAVAAAFGVTTKTVEAAIKEFPPRLLPAESP